MGITFKKDRSPVPKGFKDYCKKHTRAEAVEYYGISYEKVRFWEKKVGVKCVRKTWNALDNPEDLKILLKYFTQAEVADRIGVTVSTLNKLSDLGS